MKIDSTTFGAITIDGTTYQHDVVVRLSGKVVKRKKKLSLRERVRPSRHWFRSDGQRAPVTGSRSLFRKEGLRGAVEADTRGDPDVQPLARQEDRALSRDLLNEMAW
ncbi:MULTISPECIES: hypothetical protein [unclassified Bradyrhizobium]